MEPEVTADQATDPAPDDGQLTADPTPEQGEEPVSASADEQPLSMAESFARAKAARESATATPASEESGDGKGASDDAPAAQPEGTERTRMYDERGALQRILQLKQQGRLSELTPEARGLLTRFEQEVSRSAIAEAEAKARQEAEMKDVYLTNLALKETDPAAYVQLLDEQPDVALFMKRYAEVHPEITLDDPDARPRKSEAQIAAEIGEVYGRGFETLMDAIAEDGGLDQDAYKKLKAEFEFGKHPDSRNLATFGAKLVTAVAEVMAKGMAEKEIAKVKEAERKAYDLQLQKVRGEAANPPRQLGDSGVRQPDTRVGSGPMKMADAVRVAKEMVASR